MQTIWIPKRLVEVTLINTAARTGQYFIDECEAEYRARVELAADCILTQGCKVVMLTGPSASGKTTTAHKLAEAIRAKGHQAEVISLDDFFLDKDRYPRLPDGSKDYENIEALDIECINRCLADVQSTGITELPRFDFITESRLPDTRHLDIDGGVLIVEGIHAHNPRLFASLPRQSVYKVYAGLREEYAWHGRREIPTRDIRLVRRMVRDFRDRGHSPEKTISMWPDVCAGEDKYIKVFKPGADMLLDTSFSYEICCMTPYLEEMRRGMPDDSPCCGRLCELLEKFSLCGKLSADNIPADSMLREFFGKK